MKKKYDKIWLAETKRKCGKENTGKKKIEKRAKTPRRDIVGETRRGAK